MEKLLNIVMGLVIVGCICASTFFATRFGMSLSQDVLMQVFYGFVCGGLDLLKSCLPFFASRARREGDVPRCLCAWGLFVFLTCMSAWASFGNTAIQDASKRADQAVAANDKKEKKGTLDRLVAERKAMGFVTRVSAEVVKAQEDAVTAAVVQVQAECGEARGGRGKKCGDREADERAARAALVKAQADKALSDAAEKLDADIKEAEAKLAAVDDKKAETSANPQAEAVSKAFGITFDDAASVGYVFAALCVELGSGFGLWLVFGHGGARREEDLEPEAKPTITAIAPTPDMKELAKEARARFFTQAAFAQANSNIPSGVVHGAYMLWHAQDPWCQENNVPPLDAVSFGIKAPWFGRKTKSGVPHYLNIGIAPKFLPRPKLTVVASAS